MGMQEGGLGFYRGISGRKHPKEGIASILHGPVRKG